MTTFTVANAAGLQSAFTSAKGGDTIVLKDGYYGGIKVTADYASTVTVRAESALDATINQLTVSNGTNIKFDGIKFDSGSNGGPGGRVVSIEAGSQNIAVVNSEVTGSVGGGYDGHWGVYVRDSNGITLDNNYVHDVQSAIVMFGSANSTVRNNSVDYYSEDGFKLAGLYNSTVSGNRSLGQIYPTAGAHNDFMQIQGDSSNLTVNDNLFIAKTTGWVQGIFFAAGTYQNIKIEDNVISTGMIRGISVSDGSSGITVNNNTLINVPGYHNSTLVMVPEGSSVNNNISTSWNAGPSGSNLVLQQTNPNAAYYVNDYYKNGLAGLGLTVQDLTPVAGSAATSKGAIGLLSSLLGGGAAPTPPTTPTTPTQPGPVDGNKVAINAGSGSDAYYSGGDTYATTAGIAGTTADAIYQDERYGNFKYAVGLANGTYDVTLKFAEIYLNGAGQRLFDVKAENKLILDNFDVYAAAGGKNAAVDRTFQVAVTDGKLDLDFVNVKDNAKVNGIDIAPSSGASPAPAPAPGGTSVAINAGGKASGGFAADAFYFGGATYATTAGIAGTTDDALYQSERYGNFKYAVGLANGTYDVTLKFAEVYLSGAGQRLFDVKAENAIVLDNYDIFKEAGGKNVAHDESFQVKVTDGTLDLDFISVKDNAKIGAIEIDYLA